MTYRDTTTEELKALFTKHNHLYYYGTEDETQCIPDSEFDKIAIELAKREEFDGSKEKLTLKVNHEAPGVLGNVIHGTPMLSLQTVTDYTSFGFINFDSYVRSMLKVSNQDPLEYVCEPKYDGLGLSLRYVDGSLVDIVTRGDGSVGSSVFHARHRFDPAYLPTKLSEPYTGEIRGEGIMKLDDFDALNVKLHKEGFKPKVNPRNAVAGLVRAKDAEDYVDGRLLFLPYSLPKNEKRFKTQSDILMWFTVVGFRLYRDLLPKPYIYPSKDMASPYDYHKDIKRDKLGIEVDGVVYKLNNIEQQELLGFREREPRWAAAHKFPPTSVTTIVEGVDITFGRTGVITPVAKLRPVQVGGVTVSSCILENFFHIRRLKLRVGDRVELVRAGDTIPKIVRTFPRSKKGYVPNIKAPLTCPHCETKVVRRKGMKEHYCPNLLCDNRLKGVLINFASRGYMDIQGLGEETIEKLYQSELIKHPGDLYKLGITDLIPITGKANAIKLYKNIEASLVKEDWVVLSSIGIASVGRSVSKKICQHILLEDLFVADKVTTEAFGEKIGEVAALNKLFEFLSVLELYKNTLWLFDKFEKTLISTLGKESGGKGTIVLTGGFEGGRKALTKSLELQGWKVTSTVSRKVNYVVTGTRPTEDKIEIAQDFKIPVLTWEEFNKLI